MKRIKLIPWPLIMPMCSDAVLPNYSTTPGELDQFIKALSELAGK
ncbi:MAG TPA: hypothetical protein VIV35_10070 [Chitinophagaceae bacterium]